MIARPLARTVVPCALLLAGSLAALGGPAAAGTQSTSGAQVLVTSEAGDGVAPGAGTLDLQGTGFQNVPGGFGGIYVLFGWVAEGAWQPSEGGDFGRTYQYQPDSMSAEDNAGFQRFVSFPGSTTAAEANGGVIGEDGSWSTTLELPGPVFTVTDASGAERELDCRIETCGVITVGAHGVKSPPNETFTPVSFVDLGTDPVADPEATAEGTSGSPTEQPSEGAAGGDPDSSAPGDSATTDAAEAETDQPSEGTSGAAPEDVTFSPLGWIVAGAVVAASGAAGVWVVRRRREDGSASEKG